MPSQPQPHTAEVIPAVSSSPYDPDSVRIPLYTEEFAADPHRAYREMRRAYGALVPVDLAPGVPATLVVGYDAARRILNDPERFPADPRIWQRTVAPDCPILPMLEWRPCAIRSAGVEHARYRQATVAAVAGVDMFALRATVERLAIAQVNTFCADGTADLIQQYAFPLSFAVVNVLFGCPPEIGTRVADSMAKIFEGDDADQANAMLAQALLDLVTLKRNEPGNDLTTRLMEHPAALDDHEMIPQLVSLYGSGIEPQQNLIVNTMRLILTDDRFAGNVLGGSQSTRAALDEVLFTDPPLSNYCISYPRHPVLIDDIWLPAHQPVVISMAGCNNDPAISGADRADNSSHLSWSIGVHACPARSVAYLVVQDAIDQLLDALPEIELAVPADELTWRPGPFHRALTRLPVRFPPSPPLRLP
ncbi:cytochrome P450 [Nocardia carnea]|uniref:cytochrome P450 n=1 Tax=Nocardia carnea TaxID=37328 RepID=UPI0024577042|nr:cytochrome P450 [Nocardia carnea]